MSRYSKQDLEKFKKVELLELVRRQPEVAFPPKIGSGPLETLTVRQLRLALVGPYGYTKAIAPLQESATDAATLTRHEIIDDNMNSSSLLPSCPVVEELEPELVVSQLTTSVQAVSLDSVESESQEVTNADFVANVEAPLCSQDVSMDSDNPDAPHMNLVEAEFKMTRTFGQSSSRATSTSISSTNSDHIVDSYPENVKTDEVLLAEYFAKNPKLSEGLKISRAHRRKHLSDKTLVRDYKFNLALYKTLMDHPWENDSGRIVSKTILAHLDISAPWLAKARKVIKLVDLHGPDSSNPDPLVVERLSSTATTNKGDDFLKFLTNRAAAIEAGGYRA